MRFLVLFLLFQIPILAAAQNSKTELYKESKIVFEGLDADDIKEDLIGQTVTTKSPDPLRQGYVRSWDFENISEFIELKILSKSVVLESSASIEWNVEVSILLEDSDGKWVMPYVILTYHYSNSKRELFFVKADTLEKTEIKSLSSFIAGDTKIDLVGKWVGEDKGDIGFFIFDDEGYVILEAQGQVIGGKEFMISEQKCSMTYTVNYDVKPMEIDFTITLLETKDENKMLFIAKPIDNNTLKIASSFNSVRPTEFNESNSVILRRVEE